MRGGRPNAVAKVADRFGCKLARSMVPEPQANDGRRHATAAKARSRFAGFRRGAHGQGDRAAPGAFLSRGQLLRGDRRPRGSPDAGEVPRAKRPARMPLSVSPEPEVAAPRNHAGAHKELHPSRAVWCSISVLFRGAQGSRPREIPPGDRRRSRPVTQADIMGVSTD
jgi:hypothetical protein